MSSTDTITALELLWLVLLLAVTWVVRSALPYTWHLYI